MLLGDRTFIHLFTHSSTSSSHRQSCQGLSLIVKIEFRFDWRRLARTVSLGVSNTIIVERKTRAREKLLPSSFLCVDRKSWREKEKANRERRVNGEGKRENRIKIDHFNFHNTLYQNDSFGKSQPRQRAEVNQKCCIEIGRARERVFFLLLRFLSAFIEARAREREGEREEKKKKN